MPACKVLAPLFVEAEGKTYMPGSTVELPAAKARRLAKAGVVSAEEVEAERPGEHWDGGAGGE